MSKNPQLPLIEMLTQDEIHSAVVRAAVARSVSNPDAFIDTNEVETRVVYRNVRLPDGTLTMLASVAILSAKLKAPVPTVDTPIPSEPPKRKE